MISCEECLIGKDASAQGEAGELRGKSGSTHYSQAGILLTPADIDGLSECNEATPDNVAGSNTEQLDCLHLDPTEGDITIYSGLEHNVSQQFCLIITTEMFIKEILC